MTEAVPRDLTRGPLDPVVPVVDQTAGPIGQPAADRPVRTAVSDAFRGFMATYYTGVAVVTSIGADDEPRGLTCNSLTSVTLAPPTLLVCLTVGTGTLAAVHASGGFVVNLLHTGGQATAELFASPRPDRFDRVAWRRSPHLGLPWLVEDACAMAECRLTEVKLVGDHAVVFGGVVNVEQGPGSPLLYGRRRYAGGLT